MYSKSVRAVFVDVCLVGWIICFCSFSLGNWSFCESGYLILDTAFENSLLEIIWGLGWYCHPPEIVLVGTWGHHKSLRSPYIIHPSLRVQSPMFCHSCFSYIYHFQKILNTFFKWVIKACGFLSHPHKERPSYYLCKGWFTSAAPLTLGLPPFRVLVKVECGLLRFPNSDAKKNMLSAATHDTWISFLFCILS